MDFGKALEFPFKDSDWIMKMIWLSVFMLLTPVLIGIPFLTGYMVLTIRGVIKGNETLPEWSGNWSEIFAEGIKYCIVVLVIIIVGGIVGVVGIGLFTFAWNIIATILGVLTMARFAATGDLNDLLDFNWYINFTKNNWQNMLFVIIFSMVGGFVAGFGLIAFLIGIFFTMYVYAMMYAHLVGQMYVAGNAVVSKPASVLAEGA